MNKKSTTYFPALTGLRACTAYLIFWFHYNPFEKDGWPWRFIHEGHIGVSIFFVLSGFLICLRYAGKVEISQQWLGKYMRNRIARIYPMYFLLTCLTFFIFWKDPSYDVLGGWQNAVGIDKEIPLILNFTLLKGLFDGFIWTGVLPAWSLTVEETFYLLAPVFLLGLSLTNRKYTLLIGYAVLLLGVGCIAVSILPHNLGFLRSYTLLFNYTFFGRCVEFLLGMGFAFANSHGFSQSKKSFWTWLGIFYIAVCLVGLIRVDSPLASAPGTGSPAGVVINNLLLPFGILMLFRGLIYERTWIQRLLSTSLFDLLGKSSYCFYLIHQGFISTALDRYITTNYVMHFFIMIALSIVCFKLIEDPFHKKLVGLSSKKSQHFS